MAYIGIDPGSASGAIAVVASAGAAAQNFPATDADTYARIESVLDHYRFDASVVVEKILLTPKTRGFAGFQKVLGSYHALRGMLLALGVPFETLTPRQWQAEIGCPKGDKTDTQHKTELYGKARELFPNAKMTKRQADAFLLAEIARRRFGGQGR